MARKCFVWEDNIPYVKKVFERDGLKYSMKPKEGGAELTCNLTQKRLSEALKDALCEKERVTLGCIFPVYSIETILDRKKRNRMFRLNGTNAYYILEKDEPRFERMYWHSDKNALAD